MSIAAESAPVDLAHPFTPERLRLYLMLGSVQGLVTLLCAAGVGVGVLAPNRTVDVIANVFAFLPMAALPLAVMVLVADPIARAAELTLVWLPFTAAAQLSFELVWLIGQLFDVWKPGDDPGWTWMWWQFALTDTRYFGQNPSVFAIELAAVVAACFVLRAFIRLIRPELSDADRIRNLLLGMAGLTALTVNTLIYFASELRNGLDDLGQGGYGLVKFFALNGPYLVFPVFVLIAMGRLVVHIAGPDDPA